ncbi:MAG TPA: hypothetical protein VF635_01065 [Propionibacteriaceae bacterium]
MLLARSSGKDVWVASDFPDGTPLEQPDGSNTFLRVAAGETTGLDFVPRFKVANRGTRWGDLLWTTGDTKLASQRFIEVLSRVGASGWRRFDVEVVAARRRPVPGYHGLAVTGVSPAEDLFHPDGGPSFRVHVSDRLLQELRAAGVTEFEIEPT